MSKFLECSKSSAYKFIALNTNIRKEEKSEIKRSELQQRRYTLDKY